jgi:chromosome segregation ATPase
MASADPILNALTRMEERLLQRMEEWRRDLKLDLDGRFDAIHKRLDYLEQEYEMIKAGLARVEADVGTLKADVGTLKADVASLKGAITRLEARQEQEAPQRQDLREQVLAFSRRLGELESRVREIEGRLLRG